MAAQSQYHKSQSGGSSQFVSKLIKSTKTSSDFTAAVAISESKTISVNN